MRRTGGLVLTLLFLLSFHGAATPEDRTGGDGAGIQITDGWARIVIAGRPAAGYLQIRNASNSGDRLLSAHSGHAARVEVHEHLMDDGVMKMRQANSVTVPAGETFVLEPGGHHLMLFGLDEDIGKGGAIPVTLQFEQAGPVEAILQVGTRPGGSDSAGAHQHLHTD